MTGEYQFTLAPARGNEAVEPLWRQLDAAGGHSFFMSWTWIGTWLSTLPAEVAPRLLTVAQRGETVGAAILVPRRTKRHGIIEASQLHLNSTGENSLDCLTIEHNGFAGPHSGSPEMWSAFVRWFAAEASDADELCLPGIEGAIARTLPAQELFHAVRDVPSFRKNLLPLATSGGLEASLSRNARQKLRRNLRDYRADGELRLEEATTVERALEYFEALKELHIRSWTRRGQPHAFHDRYFEIFHRTLIACGFAKNAIQLLRISAGVRIIGYLYNFRHRGRICAYQSGFDLSNAILRPGYVCHALAIERNAQAGAVEYDFLAGRNRLKETFCDDRYAMSWCTFSRKKFRFRAERAARSMVRMIARPRS